MHSAPSVTYPVGRSRFAACLAAGIWSIGACVAVLWWLQPNGPRWAQTAMAGALIATGGFAVRSWLHSPVGVLTWDGSSWAGPAGGPGGALEVTLDLQGILLVRRHAPGSSCWVWLERRQLPERWDELRRAVYSRARPEGLARAEPPAAKP